MDADKNITQHDLWCLRATFDLARLAVQAGHRPFGAIVADASGTISQETSTQTKRGDPTAHAEMRAVRSAMKLAPQSRLRDATTFASSEPCAMCASAIFFSGVRRIVFGLSEEKLGPMRNVTPQGAGIRLTSRAVLSRATQIVSVIGPVLEAEAEAVHLGYWIDAQ